MNSKKRTIIPTTCPFMIKLEKFYESTSAVILLLQHAPGGRLWNYVSNYLHSGGNQSNIGDILDDTHERQLRHGHNTDSINNKVICDSEGYRVKQSNTPSDVPRDTKSELKPQRGNFSNPPLSSDSTINKDDIVTTESDEKLNGSVVKFEENDVIEKTDSDVQKALPELDGGDKSNLLLMGQTPSQFQDLLKSASQRPAMEAFSVNSFESDSGGQVSRFESFAEIIESIEEVSETTSPLSSPKKGKLTNEFTDVFEENNYEGKVTDNVKVTGCHNHVTTGSNEMNASHHEGGSNSVEVINKTSPVPNCGPSTGHYDVQLTYSAHSIEDKSIYDYNRSPCTDTTDSSALHSDEDDECLIYSGDMDGNHADQSGDGNHIDDVMTDHGTTTSKLVFKQPSQERSLETGKKYRHRTASGTYIEAHKPVPIN